MKKRSLCDRMYSTYSIHCTLLTLFVCFILFSWVLSFSTSSRALFRRTSVVLCEAAACLWDLFKSSTSYTVRDGGVTFSCLHLGKQVFHALLWDLVQRWNLQLKNFTFSLSLIRQSLVLLDLGSLDVCRFLQLGSIFFNFLNFWIELGIFFILGRQKQCPR